MKLNKIIYSALLAGIMMFSACNESVDIVTDNAQEGAFLSIEGSSGQLAGSPEAGVELDDAEITFQAASLEYVASISKGATGVKELVVKKSFNGVSVEVARTTEKTVTLVYDDLSDFLEGLEVSSSELRVGDVIGFQTEITMNDGRVLVNTTAALNVQVSCLADLSGTYLVTNNFCDPTPFTVTITKNPDGSYSLTSADGGFLSKCTANTTLTNAGTIIEQCGVILPSTALDFGTDGGYGIGDISGGTWDEATGTLIMDHTDIFFNGGPFTWTSTYVRQ